MNKKYKLGACGNFHLDLTFLNGQVIRSRSVINELENRVGCSNICKISYHNWKKRPISLMFQFINLMIRSEKIIIFPDLGAIRVLLPLAIILKPITNTKVYYNVIGGWLPEYLATYEKRRKWFYRIDRLFVQTNSLKEALAFYHLDRVTVFPNFKYIKIFKHEELSDTSQKPYKLVFMSRITAKKGVTQLVHTIWEINCKERIFELDLYGSIEDSYIDEFTELMNQIPDYIQYCGQVNPNETSTVMKDYFLHVFPTLYKTEGYPGSALDALCAGTPTISAHWNSFDDVFDDGYDSISFELGNWGEFKEKLLWAANNPDQILKMRPNCLEKANLYRPERVIQIMLEIIGLKEEQNRGC